MQGYSSKQFLAQISLRTPELNELKRKVPKKGIEKVVEVSLDSSEKAMFKKSLNFLSNVIYKVSIELPSYAFKVVFLCF